MVTSEQITVEATEQITRRQRSLDREKRRIVAEPSEAGDQPEFLYPADESLHPQIRREGLSYLLGTVVRHNSRHFSSRRQFHELCRACAFLICVVEHHAVYAPEHVLKAKVEFRVGF
jgi:hypothetical protein